MVFQAVLAAHHALTAKGAGAGAGQAGHLQQLDGAGSGCGPTANNCSGAASLPPGSVTAPKGAKTRLGKYPTPGPVEGKPMKFHYPPRSQGFFGSHAAIPGNHHYTTVNSREGSEQNVHYQAGSSAHNYVGWGNMNNHYKGVFDFHHVGGGKGGDNSASAMMAKNPTVTVPHPHRHHAFGNDSSNAYSLYPSHNHKGYYGHKKAMAFNKPNSERRLLPEQVVEPTRHIPENIKAEANFVSGLHSKNLMVASKLEHAGVGNSTRVSFIQNKNLMYSHHPGPGHTYGVAYATQTQRLPNGGGLSEKAQLHGFNNAINRHNSSGTSGTAYAMTAGTSKHGTRILDKPYHPAKFAYCDAFPDRCYFGPAPETQDMGSGAGGYHSI